MFENYSKEEEDLEYNRLAEDLKTQCPVARRPEEISAALDAMTGHGSDWREIVNMLRIRSLGSDPILHQNK